jgi:hypothetical protein
LWLPSLSSIGSWFVLNHHFKKFKKPVPFWNRAFIIQKIKVYLNVNGMSARNLARFIA